MLQLFIVTMDMDGDTPCQEEKLEVSILYSGFFFDFYTVNVNWYASKGRNFAISFLSFSIWVNS